LSIHEKANNAALLAGGGKNENSCVEKHLALQIPWTKYSSRKKYKISKSCTARYVCEKFGIIAGDLLFSTTVVGGQ
jgi:hypothetical protein